MELTNEFTVRVPPDRAWAVLTDLERIAPCMPGAELREVAGDEHRGSVRVKVGPITAEYDGVARFVERDDLIRRAVLRAEGRDARGQGNASAVVTATVEPDASGSRVVVVTDLTVTGKVAQFGRGLMADVSARLLAQFAERLEVDVLSARPDAPVPAPAARSAAPVDLLATAGAPALRRAAPWLALVLVVLWLMRRSRR